MDCGHQRTVSRDKVQRSASSSLYFCSQCIFHSFDSILGICKLVYMDIFLIFWDSWSLFCICVHVRLNLDPSYIQIMRQNLLYDIYIRWRLRDVISFQCTSGGFDSISTLDFVLSLLNLGLFYDGTVTHSYCSLFVSSFTSLTFRRGGLCFHSCPAVCCKNC